MSYNAYSGFSGLGDDVIAVNNFSDPFTDTNNINNNVINNNLMPNNKHNRWHMNNNAMNSPNNVMNSPNNAMTTNSHEFTQ